MTMPLYESARPATEAARLAGLPARRRRHQTRAACIAAIALAAMTALGAAGNAMAAGTASAPAAAATTAGGSITIVPAATPADATAKAAVEGTLSAIRSDAVAKGGDPVRTAQLVVSHFLPYTDFRRTARLACGDAWASATPAQQQAIFEQFQTLLVRVYAAQLTQIQGQNITFRFDKPTPVKGSADMVVRSQVHTDTDDMSTGYRMAKTPTGYKVYDIDLMGIWLIQVYQQQFRDQIRQGGVDGLIKFLQAHNTQRAG